MHVSGLQTFESVDTTTKEPQEPEAEPEVQEEQKGKNKPVTHQQFFIMLLYQWSSEKQDRTFVCSKSN